MKILDIMFYYSYLFVNADKDWKEWLMPDHIILGTMIGFVISFLADIPLTFFLCEDNPSWIFFIISGGSLVFTFYTYYVKNRKKKVLEEKPYFLKNKKSSIVLSAFIHLISLSTLIWSSLLGKYILDEFCR